MKDFYAILAGAITFGTMLNFVLMIKYFDRKYILPIWGYPYVYCLAGLNGWLLYKAIQG